jgi:alkanesulfonate monooxygenase SsuD/methylene tetrahydromethanopterin reductase-like flavin-dependent oxidoreductase (luciferase family)
MAAMKFNLFVLPTVPGTYQERRELRPIARRNDRYQQMLQELRDITVLAEELGFDALSTTEHHFHSEGYETSVAPLMLYTDLAARTKKIKFASLGLVLPTRDPLRTAEEIAVLDHLTKGRFIAGFARGYQDRWTNVLGQHYHVSAATMDGSAVDNHNREVFEEMFHIIKMAWTEESIRFKGKYYEVPTPYDGGIQRWPVGKTWTAELGAAGEVDEAGAVQRICVVPKPYTTPYPEIWQPFSVSEKTIRWCATEGIVPWILISYPSEFKRMVEAYQDEAAKHGFDLPLGQRTAAFRSIHFGRDFAEAYRFGKEIMAGGWIPYFGGFGFFEAFRFPGEKTPVPLTYDRMIEAKYALVGTVDDVKRDIEQLHRDTNAEWFGWYFDQGLMSWDETRRQLESFAKIIREFKGN